MTYPNPDARIAQALFRAKMKEWLKERNLTNNKFFEKTGFTPAQYNGMAYGGHSKFTTIIQFIALTEGHFTYEEMAKMFHLPTKAVET